MPAVIRREAPARAHRAERRPDDTCGDVSDEVHASRDLRTTRAVEHQVGDEMHLGDVEAARRSVMTHASDFVHALRRLGTGRASRGRRPSTGTSVKPGAPGRIKPTGRTCHLGAPGNQASRDEAPPRAPGLFVRISFGPDHANRASRWTDRAAPRLRHEMRAWSTPRPRERAETGVMHAPKWSQPG